MFNATRNQILGLILLAIPTGLSAQTGDSKQTNQAVFNRIEYHFNLREADSIYLLSSPVFRKNTSGETFRRTLEDQLFPLGRIRSATMQFYDEDRRTGFYQLALAGTGLLAEVTVDTNLQFSHLNFKPYTPPSAPEKPAVTETLRTEESAENKRMASLAREYIQHSGTRKLAIGMIDNRRVYTGFYGPGIQSANVAPDSPGILFDLGPASDLFAATMLAYMVETGQVDLYAPIADYLPDTVRLKPDLAAINLQQLANHTSGLPQLPAGWNRHYTAAEFWIFMEQYQSEIPAGSSYRPSNLGYTLLPAILSNVAGVAYEEMIHEYICIPLGLENTKRIQGPDSTLFMTNLRIRSTLDDMIHFAGAHFELPESPIQYALAQTRQFTFYDPPETDIGLGWKMQLRGNNLIYWHESTDNTSSVYIALDPDRKKAVVVLSDTGVAVAGIGEQLMDALITD